MHSSYYIYEGESTNNYVSEVKDVKTFFFILGHHLCLSVKPVHSLAISNHSSNIDSLSQRQSKNYFYDAFIDINNIPGLIGLKLRLLVHGKRRISVDFLSGHDVPISM